MKKNQLDIKHHVDSAVLFAAIAVVAVFAAGFLPEPGESTVTAARGLGGFPFLFRGTGSFWGDALVMTIGAWICLRWTSGIDDVKTVKSKRKREWWRRISFP